ncbi:MAG: hypothetical protein P8129_01145 [Anaerolineae bacterium]
MKSYGRASVHEIVGDLIVYRNLEPVDRRLPALAEIRGEAGLAEGVIPRKSEAAYARVIVHLLRAARALDAPEASLRRLVSVGDTRLNDGTAFANICRAGGWPGLAFIAAEKDEPAEIEIVEQDGGTLFLANRWAALDDFESYCRDRGFALDEATAVVVDLDKTTLGARGRNDHVIDGARVEAVRRTVGQLLGDDWDPAAFQRAYDLLNQPEFHPFTTDNQDYLAYICLILGSGLDDLAPVVARIRSGALAGFGQFLAEVDGRAGQLPADLREIHAGIYARVRAGDPTPFKAFRYNEYRVTVERMGCLADGAPLAEMLANEIVMTQEVRQAALRWRAGGALLFALSDKPDEASVPSEELAVRGYQPIHRTETHAVGDREGR